MKTKEKANRRATMAFSLAVDTIVNLTEFADENTLNASRFVEKAVCKELKRLTNKHKNSNKGRVTVNGFKNRLANATL